jgi:hypothetical protein
LFNKQVLSVTSKYNLAQVVKSVDTRDLKSLGCKAVRVQVPPWAPSLLDKEFGAKKKVHCKWHWEVSNKSSIPVSLLVIRIYGRTTEFSPGGEIGRHKGFKIPRL